MASKAKVEHYRRLNGKYLREAEELLAKKDYPQASEKLWGATADIMECIAAQRGITLGTHRSLAEYVEKLDALIEFVFAQLKTHQHVTGSNLIRPATVTSTIYRRLGLLESMGQSSRG